MALFEINSNNVITDVQVGTATANVELELDTATTTSQYAVVSINATAVIRIAWGVNGVAPAATSTSATEDATGFVLNMLAGELFIVKAKVGDYISGLRVNTSGTPAVRVTYFR